MKKNKIKQDDIIKNIEQINKKIESSDFVTERMYKNNEILTKIAKAIKEVIEVIENERHYDEFLIKMIETQTDYDAMEEYDKLYEENKIDFETYKKVVGDILDLILRRWS